MFIYTSILFTEPAVTISSWSSLVIQFENNHIPERFLDWTLSSLVAPQLPLINREKKKEKRGREREKKKNNGGYAFERVHAEPVFILVSSYLSFFSLVLSFSLDKWKENTILQLFVFFLVIFYSDVSGKFVLGNGWMAEGAETKYTLLFPHEW